MKAMSERQYVEVFHLLFLGQLGRKVDKRFYTLKGGCNLRFFFRSPRYSEDMDLDAGGLPVHKLEDIVDNILKSRPFEQILHVRGIRIEHINNDKQTDTTQRWKLGLALPRAERSAPTKIEFSRRGMDEDVEFDAVDPLLTAGYELPAVMTNHYLARSALKQKIQALADRRESQARDIFDLNILLNAGAVPGRLAEEARDKLRTARDNALRMDFSAFRSQVAAYLPLDDQAACDEDAWDAMRLRVCEALDKVSP